MGEVVRIRGGMSGRETASGNCPGNCFSEEMSSSRGVNPEGDRGSRPFPKKMSNGGGVVIRRVPPKYGAYML